MEWFTVMVFNFSFISVYRMSDERGLCNARWIAACHIKMAIQEA